MDRRLAGRSYPEVAGVVCSRAVRGTAVASRLALRRARRSLGARWEQKEKARAGEPPRRATAGCSFATRRGSPASDTLEPKRGAMQGLSAARTTRTDDVRWHATAPTRARPRAGRRSLAGTALRATPPSACCPIVWRRACPAPSMSSKRWWRMASRRRVWPQRAMRCAAMRSSSPGAMRWVERRVRLVHHVLSVVIGLLPDQLARCIPEMGAVRTRLQTETALRALRTLVAEQLPVLPAPLGFQPHRLSPRNRLRARQHKMGADPPPALA